MKCVLAIVIVLLFLLLADQLLALAAYCHGKPQPDALQNLNPINTADPIFINSTKNGKLYTVGQADDSMWLLHVWGTPYEMGYAHGTLLKEQLHEFIPQLLAYIDSQVEAELKDLPDWLTKILAEKSINAALDATFLITKKYTPSYFYEELQGIADASGISYDDLRRIHMIGELTKADCSMFGAWGEATNSTGSPTLQLRALDWDVDGPFKSFPAIVVYHPSGGFGHAFANVGFVGWIGSISGMSSVQTAISEIGVSFPDATFGKDSRFGIPFTFLLRDILQFDYTLDDAIDRITSAKRTCDLILGVGDAKLGTFRGFQYSASVANVIDDENLIPKNDTWHAPIKNVVYFGMDWLCPGYNQLLGEQINRFWGEITPEITISDIVAKTQTGNLQVCVYDLTNQFMYVSYAQAPGESGEKYAYQRQYTRIDMQALFNEHPPSDF